MNAKDFLKYTIKPAQIHLPVKMRTPAARAMLIAIAIQESRIEHRTQLIGSSRRWWQSLNGPARGFWQFEAAGVAGVMSHATSASHVKVILGRLHFPEDVTIVHRTLAFNDTLATCFARLLLWTVPERLPRLEEAEEAWQQYLRAWRPGKPHPETWDAAYRTAWMTVLADLECHGDTDSASWLTDEDSA